MKVLFINTVYGKGSTGRIVSDLGQAVEKSGGEYRAAYGRGSSNDPHAVKIGTQPDTYLHALAARITDRAGFYSKNSTRELIAYIRSYAPDIIHIHNLHGYYINAEILFDYLKHEFTGKVIWTLHDCWAFTGHCVHFTWANCSRWQTGCYRCPEKRRYPKSVCKDSSSRNYLQKKELFTGIKNLTIVTPSAWLAEQVKKSYLKDYPVRVINNGIDLRVFRIMESEEKNKTKSPRIVLNIMDGLDNRKGYKDLVDLSRILPETYRIVIVGLTEKECKMAPDTVTAIARTENVEELVKLYNQAICFVNPTYEDTFPTVNIEALACGTPVIAYNSCGNPEALSHECGIIVNCGDVEGLKKAVLSCSFASDDCRKRALSFDRFSKYSEYIELYKEEQM